MMLTVFQILNALLRTNIQKEWLDFLYQVCDYLKQNCEQTHLEVPLGDIKMKTSCFTSIFLHDDINWEDKLKLCIKSSFSIYEQNIKSDS